MLGKRIINTATGAAPSACTTDTVQILDGVPFQSIATYQLDGNANDLTTNYNGTASNVTYTTGKFGQAAVFNGSSSVIRDIPNSISTSLKSNNAFTYSFWIKFNSLGNQSIIQFFNDVTSSVSFNGTNFEAYIYNSSAQQRVVINSASVTTGVWYNVVFKGDSNGIFLYVNNNTPASTSWGGDWFIYTNATYKYNAIGARQDSGGFTGYVDGTIDQVRIFNTALSAGAVTSLYNETVATASNSYINLPSLVAYYKMSDATDETGSYDGTASNVNFNVAGKFGNAGEFNGSNSYINYDSLTFPSNDFTFSAWANTENVSAQYNMITTTAKNGSGYFYLTFEYDKLYYYDTGSSVALQSSSGTISNGTWYHCVITKSSTSGIKLYLNGVQVDSNSVTASNTTTGTGQNRIGHYYTPTSTGFFDGKIDQVRIFNRAITATEVETLYNEVQCIPDIVPSEHFNAVTYTGDGTTNNPITSVGFEPDFVWIKNRDYSGGISHQIFDSVRGDTAGSGGSLSSNNTNVEYFDGTKGVKSFDIDGFTLDGGVNGEYGVNGAPGGTYGSSYVSWNWKAGGTAVSNTDGTITSQVSANTDAGFSIVKWTGANTTSTSVGHGLDAAPEMVILRHTNVAGDWRVYHDGIPDDSFLYLNQTSSLVDININKIHTATTISQQWTGGSYDWIAYCFHSVDGYSKFGSYTGTGGGGNSIVTGFEPAFVMVKKTNAANDWIMLDSKRKTDNPINNPLRANTSGAETPNNTNSIDFNSNGFTIVGTAGGTNTNGDSYIFMAFAADPAPEPVLANSFNTVTYTGNGGTQSITSLDFQPDLVWMKSRSNTWNNNLLDSVRGDSSFLVSDSSNAAAIASGYFTFDSNGFTVIGGGGINQNNDTFVSWNWKAAELPAINNNGSISSVVSANPAAGFSVVSFTAPSSGIWTYGHQLNVAPELIITKNLTQSGQDWQVFLPSILGNNKKLILNATSSEATTGVLSNTNPTDTVITQTGYGVGTDNIAYCFHSVDGHQKVGSYTMNGSALTIDVGFAPRFFLYKEATRVASWVIADNLRSAGGNYKARLFADLSAAESTSQQIQFVGNTVILNYGSTGNNATSGTGIYLAIA